jgi:hypothetical protein
MSDITKPNISTSQLTGKFSTLEERDLEYFKTVLGENGVITDADDLKAYTVDWMVRFFDKIT